jgi:hypothetical protein
VANPYPTGTFTLPETPSLSWRENARRELRLEAEATQERTLEAVSSTPLLGRDSTPELQRARVFEPGPGFPARLTPSLWLRMVLYDFIELNEYAVWVQGKRTANRPCGRLEQRVWWDDKRHPFALEVGIDRI